MMILDLFNQLPIHDSLSLVGNSWHDGATILAQRIEDPDILGKIQRSFKHFIESGQVWALGIGFVMGYMFRNFTAY